MTPAYERDPQLRSLRAEVIGVGFDGARPYAVLSDTILFPEGGGQPADRGSIDGVGVLDVQRVGGEIRHYLAAPRAPGPALVELDWERRFDHMQQHTAQHLLTALAQDRFGWATTSFHLGADVSDIELDVSRLTDADAEALEQAAAAEIRAARPVRARRTSFDQLAQLRVRTRGRPEDFIGDVRLVEIEGVDLNTCGGTHVRTLAEIESIKLLEALPMRGGTRLHFVAGGRVRRRLAVHEARADQLRRLFGASDDELVQVGAHKLDQLKDALRRTRKLEEELAQSAAAWLAGGPEPVAAAHWDDRDAGFLQLVARELTRRNASCCVLLTAGVGDAGAFLVWSGAEAEVDAGTLGRAASEVLDGRGGGAGTIFQGRAARLSRRDAARRRLVEILGDRT